MIITSGYLPNLICWYCNRTHIFWPGKQTAPKFCEARGRKREVQTKKGRVGEDSTLSIWF